MVSDSNLSGFEAAQPLPGSNSVWARFGRWLSALVLSANPKQKLLLIRSLTSMLVYAITILMVQYSIFVGLIVAPYWVHWLQIGMVVWVVGLYAFLRSGLNWLLGDPGLTLFQILGANLWIILAYALCPPVRGGMLILIILVLVFNMFEQTRRGQIIGNAWTLALMGAVQWHMSRTYPADFPPQVELFHWVMLAAVVPTVSLLGAQINAFRVKLQVQKSELVEALDRIRDMAQRDELTGLCNRRYMNELLPKTIRRKERSGKSLSVCLVDIDFFKRVNDVYGHSVGDEVLRDFAALGMANLRPTDTMARWGGEEFLLLMYDTRIDQAQASVQRLRESVSAWRLKSAPDLRLAFSAGIAEFLPGERADAAIERADQALYQAKHSGRNQSVLADAP